MGVSWWECCGESVVVEVSWLECRGRIIVGTSGKIAVTTRGYAHLWQIGYGSYCLCKCRGGVVLVGMSR
jgi:hypothetical protein